MKNTSPSIQEAIALRRMSLVQAVLELIQCHWPLSAALEQVSSTHPLPGDSEAPPQFVARRTLEDWYYAFKKAGFEGLKPKLRSDRGKPRRLSQKQQQWILEQVRCFPGVPVKLLYRQWKQADPTLPALSAVYRWLEQNDLDAQGRRYLLRQNIPGPTKAFEAPGVNDLWIADFSPGPFLALRGLKVQLELDPWIKNPILVRYKGQDFGAARKVDRHLNSQIQGGEVQP
jgi:transposase